MTGKLDRTAYKEIKVFKQTYKLPVIGGNSFDNFQARIQQRQAIIKTGKREEKVFLWIKGEKEVDFEERFAELDYLVRDYNNLIAFLKKHRQAYQSFFVSLTDELQDVVSQELKRVYQDELDRRNLEQELAQQNANEELLNTIKTLKQQNYQTLLMFGNAFLLMLKKVEVISKGIEKLVDDQDAQKQIIDQMVRDLNNYRKVYKLKQRMDNTRRRAQELINLAVNLEKILSPVLGEFQGLINQIVEIDGELNSTVAQIQDLVQNITDSNGLFTFEGYNQVSANLLDFLVINE